MYPIDWPEIILCAYVTFQLFVSVFIWLTIGEKVHFFVL